MGRPRSPATGGRRRLSGATPSTSRPRSAKSRSSSPRPASSATTTSPSCRRRGSAGEEIMKKARSATTRCRRESDELRYMLYAIDARRARSKWEREAVEDACRAAAATARTPTRRKRRSPTVNVFTCRSGRTSACSSSRWTASCSGRSSGRRSRSTSTSAPRHHRSSTTDASTWCTTARRLSYITALDAKTGDEIWTDRPRPRPGSRSHPG